LSTRRIKLPARDLTIFALLGALMFLTKFIMQWLPNIHLLGLFIAAFTLCYRVRALIPLYVYILLDGLLSGFSMWWIPYLYIWLPLWVVFMLAGKLALPQKLKIPLYMVLCGLHGLCFGTLYAPAQALMFGLSFKGMLAWIAAGLPFDVIHGASNFVAAALIVPLSNLLIRLDRQGAKNGG
jgi:energy-coupling factor transport system substrate-specific component